MERSTKTVETPGGHAAVIHTYLTGGEADTLKELIEKAIGKHLGEDINL